MPMKPELPSGGAADRPLKLTPEGASHKRPRPLAGRLPPLTARGRAKRAAPPAHRPQKPRAPAATGATTARAARALTREAPASTATITTTSIAPESIAPGSKPPASKPAAWPGRPLQAKR